MKPLIQACRLSALSALCMLISSCNLGPKPGVETSGNNIIIHVETLAEYPTRVDRIIIIKERQPGEKIFEAASDHGQIWRIVLHAGENDLRAVKRAGTYKVLIPNTGSFVLLRNEPYRVSICYRGRCNSKPFSFK